MSRSSGVWFGVADECRWDLTPLSRLAREAVDVALQGDGLFASWPRFRETKVAYSVSATGMERVCTGAEVRESVLPLLPEGDYGQRDADPSQSAMRKLEGPGPQRTLPA